MRKVVVAVGVALLCLGAGAVAATDQEGAGEISSESGLATDRSAIAELLGVDAAYATARESLQERAGVLQARLDANPGRHGGMWIEDASGGPMVVLVAVPGERDWLLEETRAAGLASEARIVEGDASVEDLLKAVQQASEAVSVPHDSTIDVRIGEAEIRVAPGNVDPVRGVVAHVERSTGIPTRVVAGALAEPNDVWGGLKLSTCTAGFTVRNSAGTRGILTAGHCNNTQSITRSNGTSTPLTYVSGSIVGSNDQQWATSTDLELGRFNVDFNYSTYRTVAATKSRTNQPLGASVCKFGKVIGYKCGTITDRYMAPGYLDNPENTFMRLDSGANVCSSNGDSGGPVFYSSTAYGIISGGVGAGSNVDCIYMAINYTSNLGLSVYVP